MDKHKNFAYSHVATAPSPATSGTTLIVDSGEGALFPDPPFNVTVWPDGELPLSDNAEIVRVTNVSTDTLTIDRAEEGTSAKSVAIGWQIANTITDKVLTDVENDYGGVYFFPYIYSDAVGGGDPGTGAAAFNDTDPSAITTMYLNYIGSDGIDRSDIMAVLEASSSTTKGTFRVALRSDPTQYFFLNLSNSNPDTGFYSFDVIASVVNTAGFTDGDEITIFFDPVGDKGDTGIAGTHGGAIAIPYTFSTTTTDSDPGDGVLRLNQATQNTATVIRADLLDNLATDWSAVLITLDDSTTTPIRGHIRLSKVGDNSKWLLFTVSAVASPSGYRNLTVSNVGSSTASPFSDADSIVLTFTRTGNEGTSAIRPGWDYFYDSSATNSSGMIEGDYRINHANHESATELYLKGGNAAGDPINLMDNWDDYGGTVKGYLMLQGTSAIKWVNYAVTNIAQAGGVTTLTVTFQDKQTSPGSTEKVYFTMNVIGTDITSGTKTTLTGLLKGNGTVVSAASAGTDYYNPGGTDVAIADGGTGASTAAAAATALGLGTGDSPQFNAVNIGDATDTTVTRVSPGVIAVEGVTLGLYPPGHIYGLIMSNAADVNNDITIAAGSAMSDDGTTNMVLAAPITKQLDAAWAVGTNVGGLNTGAEANSTWYEVHLIKRTDTGVVDVMFTTTGNRATLPANYTKKRRIGWIRNDGSGNILAFQQIGERFTLSVAINDYAAAASATGAVATLTVPPNTVARFRASAQFTASTNAQGACLFAETYEDRTAGPSPTTGLGSLGVSDIVGNTMGHFEILADSSSQIWRDESNATAVTMDISTYGWIDQRGRLQDI